MDIVAIPDIHAPFADKKAIKKALKVIREKRPKVVIQLGDIRDAFSFSKYAKDLSAIGYTPEQEFEAAQADIAEFWDGVKKASPKSKLLLISDANHDARLEKRLQEQFPEAAFLGKYFKRLALEYPGVELVESETELDGVLYMHGNRAAFEHAPFYQMSCVTGHTHTAGIKCFANANGPFWEMNCGYLGLKTSPVFAYRESKKIDKTVHAVGIIDDRNPSFILL